MERSMMNFKQLNDPKKAEQFFMSALINLFYESGIEGILKIINMLPEYEAHKIINELKNLEPNKWVNVEDKTPPEGTAVIGYSEDYEKCDTVVFQDGSFWMIGPDGLESFEFSDMVTHWQHFPKTPVLED
jgi:hypothetical protein